jgi:hypothetical protein
MKHEIRYPYHRPERTIMLDALDLAKWPMRRILSANPQQTRLPDILKRRVIASYARQYKLEIFVESGTYLGGTVAFMRRYCRQVYSVEFQPHLAQAAQKRFAGDSAICIFQGDGSLWIPRIVAELQEPALFWLDGHFATGTTREGETACPTLLEMSAVLKDSSYDHVVLVDDVSDFKGEGGYPTIEAVKQFVLSTRPDVSIEVKSNILRIARR